jgi:hypothetical protein
MDKHLDNRTTFVYNPRRKDATDSLGQRTTTVYKRGADGVWFMDSMDSAGEAKPVVGDDRSIVAPAPGSDPLALAAADAGFRVQSFQVELRAAGAASVVEKSVDVKTLPGKWFVAVDAVEVCTARGDGAAGAQGAISSAIVQAGMRGDKLVCVARLSDYAAEDLVVIRVTGRIIAIE